MKKIMDPKSGSILSKVIMVTLLTGLGIPCVVSAQKIAEENLGHYNLDEIIVTATATPVGSQMKTNAAVTIITREDIEARHYCRCFGINTWCNYHDAGQWYWI